MTVSGGDVVSPVVMEEDIPRIWIMNIWVGLDSGNVVKHELITDSRKIWNTGDENENTKVQKVPFGYFHISAKISLSCKSIRPSFLHDNLKKKLPNSKHFVSFCYLLLLHSYQ